MNPDKENMLETLRSFPQMVKVAASTGEHASPKELVDNIVVCGMGGSGFAGDLLKCYLYQQPFPVHVVKDYTLPKFVSKKTMVFAVSYSGNTEETVSAYRSAVRKTQVISISSGGKLLELSKMNKNPHEIIPKGIQPRLSTPYLFIPMLNVLSNSGLIEDHDQILEKAHNNLVNLAKNIELKGQELAQKIKTKVPIIYSSQKLYCLAEKWKTDINENSKTHAFYNTIPEFNHNEICGYENMWNKYHVIILSDRDDNPKIRDRINVFKKLVKNAEITEIGITGDSYLTRILSTIWMGMFVGYFLAIEYNIDPTPVNIIEKFKKELR